MFYNSNARATLLTDNTNTRYFAYLFLVQLVMFSIPLGFGFKALPTIIEVRANFFTRIVNRRSNMFSRTIDCITSVIS